MLEPFCRSLYSVSIVSTKATNGGTQIRVFSLSLVLACFLKRRLLAETRAGARICIALLDRMVTLYDAEDSSDGGKAFDYG
jgi:hypothetical protein